MTEYLLFTLYAPLAAMGDIAVGERRDSWDRPGKSAVLGLVAAALGLERDDDLAHLALHDDHGYAVRIDCPGTPLTDYHTAQVPRSKSKVSHATRRDELSAPARGARLETILSRRDYRVDAAYTAALWQRSDSKRALRDIAVALEKPHFSLYLGRKACPLGLPLDPTITTNPGLLEALAGRPVPKILRTIGLEFGASARLAFDTDATVPSGGVAVVRRDTVTTRSRWQFAPRTEHEMSIPLTNGGE